MRSPDRTLRSRSPCPSAPPPSRSGAASPEGPLIALGLVALGCVGAGASGCTLTRASADPCESARECRQAFGFGYECLEGGLCALAERRPRCDETFPPGLLEGDAGFADAFVIGAIADETLETHRARQNAVRLAFREARDQGGVDGRPVGVVFCSNEVNPTLDALDQEEATRELVRYLHGSLAIDAVVGPPSSGATAAAFEVAAPEGVLLVSPSATSPSLTSLEPPASDDAPGLLWRTAPPDSLQGRVIAADLASRSITSVALIVQDGSYGNGLAEVFEAAFEGTVRRLPFRNASERDAAATTAGSGPYEEVLFISSQTSDASAFLLFASTFPGYEGKTLFLTDSARNLDLLRDAASASPIFPRVRGTAPAPPGGVTYDAFQGTYFAEYGQSARDLSFTAHAHDAAWLLLLGATWAHFQERGRLEGRAIARGLRRLSSGVPVELGVTPLSVARDRFRLGEGVDVEGASGALDYDPSTEETAGPVEVWTIAPDATAFVAQYEVTP